MSGGMFEFSDSKAEVHDPNKSVEFYDQPVQCQCVHCRQDCVSTVSNKNSWVTYLIAFIVFLFLGHFSICVLPFIWSLLQDTVHKCPSCLNVIARRSRINLPSFRNSVMTFRFGTCAVVLTRKYVLAVMVLLLLVLFGSSIRWLGRNLTREDIFRGEQIPDAWGDFIERCGARSYLRNPLHARSEFNKHFYGKTVNWTGTLMVVSDSFFHKGVSIRMHPTQHTSQIADLDLSYDKHLESSLSQFAPGAMVEFNATLVSMSMRKQPALGILWEIQPAKVRDETAEQEALAALQANELLNIMFGGIFSGMRGGGVQVVKVGEPIHMIEISSSIPNDPHAPHHMKGRGFHDPLEALFAPPPFIGSGGHGSRSKDEADLDRLLEELLGLPPSHADIFSPTDSPQPSVVATPLDPTQERDVADLLSHFAQTPPSSQPGVVSQEPTQKEIPLGDVDQRDTNQN